MKLLDRLFRKAGDTAIEGYCFKCKVMREMKNPAEVSMKNGRLRTQGLCGTCGTRMSTTQTLKANVV